MSSDIVENLQNESSEKLMSKQNKESANILYRTPIVRVAKCLRRLSAKVLRLHRPAPGMFIPMQSPAVSSPDWHEPPSL